MGRPFGSRKNSELDLLDAIREGAVLRVRPKAMTVAVIITGLVPIMLGEGTGSESNAKDRSTHGRWYDYGTIVIDVCSACGLSFTTSQAIEYSA